MTLQQIIAAIIALIRDDYDATHARNSAHSAFESAASLAELIEDQITDAIHRELARLASRD